MFLIMVCVCVCVCILSCFAGALYTIVQGQLSDIKSRRLTSAPTTRIALDTEMGSIPYSVWMARRAIKLDAELFV
jgi:hypothetical protein